MQICFILFMKNNEEDNLDQKLTFWNFLLLFDTNHLHFMTTDLFQLNLIGDFQLQIHKMTQTLECLH